MDWLRDNRFVIGALMLAVPCAVIFVAVLVHLTGWWGVIVAMWIGLAAYLMNE